ncbi:MAG: DHS-like NAD/FAD-binding domain-containing protein [Monoraphidium minutum]|nr:MAG: DHS-like NAD/FAD-binding domain-containing protein [Monoraphidium minutum]
MQFYAACYEPIHSITTFTCALLACRRQRASSGPHTTMRASSKLASGPRRSLAWGWVLRRHRACPVHAPEPAGPPAASFGAARACAARAAPSAATQMPREPADAASRHRERIAADGSLRIARDAYGRQAPQQQQQGAAPQPQQQQQQQRPPGLAAAAPVAPPLHQDRLEELVELIASSRRVIAITGAGVSTESNIPDYRGPSGAYTTGFTPMTHAQFMRSPENRARYWHRSFCGWAEFAHCRPNAAHEGLARLQAGGWVDHTVTQNVDRLHHKAGADPRRVLELHGTTHRVVCMDCGAESCRHDLQSRLGDLNPEASALLAATMAAGDEPGRWRRALRAGTAADARATTSGEGAERVPVRRPDGDVELVDAGRGFVVPACSECGDGVLKPEVTFFGDSVRPDRAELSRDLAGGCDLLLAVGTSLMVWSAFRLAKAAKERGAKVAIVCVGETRADGIADWKAEALAGEVLARLAGHPRLLLPRI